MNERLETICFSFYRSECRESAVIIARADGSRKSGLKYRTPSKIMDRVAEFYVRLSVHSMMKRLFTSISLALFCCLTPALARDDYRRVTTLDAESYRIQLELQETGDEIRAETEIAFIVNADGVTEVPLDFGALTIDRVTVDGRDAVAARHDNGKLNIRLPQSYRRGERFRVTMRYHGRPADGLYFKQNKHGDRTIFADNWPNRAHFWFPSIDHPYDKATVEFLITAPARYDVVANGELLETTSQQNGMKLTRWRSDVPTPVYCMVFGATEFSIIKAGGPGATPVYYYLFPRDRDHGARAMARAPRMVEYYSSLIGPFPYEKLAYVQSSTRFGGMENSSAIFLDEKAIKADGAIDGLLAHETAHQWFGDSVTEADWHHLWLSEGFATYFGALFFEHADGREAFVKSMLANKESYLKATEMHSRPIYDPAITDLFKLLNRNNYAKGAWVLHMLRRRMGDEKFFAGVRDYYRAYRERTALTEDFRRVMEKQAGHSLADFFQQWIYEPGHPVFDAAWHWDEATKSLRLRVRQTQTPTVFKFPLEVLSQTGRTTKRDVVEVTEREQSFTFRLEARPTAVTLDPDEWLLKVLTLKEEGTGQRRPQLPLHRQRHGEFHG
jgi:aminopeptidase N